MTQFQIRVDDAGRHQVYATEWGVDRRDVGEPFDTPRAAIEYANELEGWGPASRPVTHPDLARALGAASRDEDPSLAEASDHASTAGTCAGCGGSLPPGRHGQRRLTCSPACRRRAARRAAAEAVDADTDGADALSHLPEPFQADPTPPVARAAGTGRATEGAGAAASPGPEAGSLLLGL